MNFKSVGKFSATYLLELWFEIYLPIMTNHCLLQISIKKKTKKNLQYLLKHSNFEELGVMKSQ